MGWQLAIFADLSWVPEGVGGTGMRSTGGMANVPGINGIFSSGIVPNAQVLRFQQGETVLGVSGTPPTATTISNALTAAATDLGTQMTTSAVIAQITAWQTGGP